MKSQSTRGGKQNSFSGAPTNSHQGFSGYSGSRKGSVKQGGANSNQNSAVAADSQNRLIGLLANATGKTVISTVSSGARYKGILSSLNIGVSGDEALSIVLLKPVLVSKSLINEKSNVDQKLPAKLVIESKDLIDIEVAQPYSAEPLEVKEKSPELIASTQTETTTETTIPAQKEPVSSFKTDRDISANYAFKERELQRWVPDENTPELTLEDSGGKWDQFKVNEERFGVESTYDEHLYTTKINTEAKDYRERLLRAERLAKEIEGSASSDHHVLEERGVVADDSGLDEEDKYSGVIQDKPLGKPDTRGTELMAALRNATASTEPVAVSTGDGKYSTPRQRAAQYHNDPAIVSSSATRKVDGVKSPDVVKVKDAGNAKDKTAQKVPSIPAKPQLTESQGEAFRLNAQSEFNALREFSANFKIPHKMPNDLLPILAKDKLKQDEILKKQEKNKNGEKPDPVSVPKVPSSANSPALSKSTVSSATSEQKKEGPKFKLNPKAAAFTPSSQLSPVPPKASFNKSPSNSSPRTHNQRPYSSSSSSSGPSARRHFQISAADFFGGADKVPTAESQKTKIETFKNSFNMFATAVRNHVDKSTPLVLEKAFKTPPAWDSTVDESYDKIIARNSSKGPQLSPGASGQFMSSPMMGVPNGVPPLMAGGYTGGKFPHVQQPMAQFQQPFHPSMMYPQFQGGVPPGSPQVMYAPPGVDPSLFPPGGFIVPGYMGSPPLNGGAYQGMSPQSHHAGQSGHHGRRYNQNKRGSANER